MNAPDSYFFPRLSSKSTAATTPESKVSAPMKPMAHESPKRSAMTPAEKAPTA